MISGLPASGKTTVGRRLAPALGVQLIDKDDILERLFESRGAGDAAQRRRLSRESDEILVRETESSDEAVLVSFWRLPGMPPDSGTPLDWLTGGQNRLVNVHCACDPETAARRFVRRQRHPGHLDARAAPAAVLASLRQLADLPQLDLGPRIEVDTTSSEWDLDAVVVSVKAALELEI